MDTYAGKHVIVTGAAGDIGSKVVRKLYKAGVTHLVMFVRNKDNINSKTVQTINSNKSPTQVHFVECDFQLPQLIEQKFNYAMQNHLMGRIDHIFLCHGVV